MDIDKITPENWNDEKWDAYTCVAESMAEEHSCEDLLLTLSDILSEYNQYIVRKASPSGGTLYKHGDLVDLFKYQTKTVVYMMQLAHAMKKHKNMQDMVEKSEIISFYDEYCAD